MRDTGSGSRTRALAENKRINALNLEPTSQKTSDPAHAVSAKAGSRKALDLKEDFKASLDNIKAQESRKLRGRQGGDESRDNAGSVSATSASFGMPGGAPGSLQAGNFQSRPAAGNAEASPPFPILKKSPKHLAQSLQELLEPFYKACASADVMREDTRWPNTSRTPYIETLGKPDPSNTAAQQMMGVGVVFRALSEDSASEMSSSKCSSSADTGSLLSLLRCSAPAPVGPAPQGSVDDLKGGWTSSSDGGGGEALAGHGPRPRPARDRAPARPPPPAAAAPPAGPAGSGDELAEQQGGGAELGPAAPARGAGAPRLELALADMADEELVRLVPRNADGELTSWGSRGHDLGTCKSPCLFWHKKMCNKGVRCGYCHFFHKEAHRKQIRPSKRTRQYRRLAAEEDIAQD